MEELNVNNGNERLDDVAELLRDDLMDLDSENDKDLVVKRLIQVEELIKKNRELEVEKLKLLEEKKANESKAAADARKLEIEAKRVEYEKPAEKTLWDKVVDFGKAWGGVIAGGLALGGIIIHESVNRKNLSDVTKFEETGTFRSTGFRKWIK